MNDYIINVCGDVSRAAWLIKGTENVLYDTGMAYSAPKMIENLKRELGDEPLHAVLLSHSHYDHVSGLPFVRKEWPDAIVYGSEYAAGVLEKPRVRKTMKNLSDVAARGAGLPGAPEYDETAFKIDRIVKEGDCITAGNTKIMVYETPGHTRCSLSFLVNDDVVMASESVGVFNSGFYMPCYLVSYQMCLDAVEKLRRLPAKRVFISHQGIQQGKRPEEIWDYLENRLLRSKEEIIDIIETYDTEEERLMQMKKRYHDNMVSEAEQPSEAFLLNAAATLKLVEKECMGENA